MVNKLFIALVLSLVLVLGTAAGVKAQEATLVTQTENIPNPDSSFFGLQMAFFRLKQNLQLAVTRSEEKKAELELRFAKQEESLQEKIETSVNPDKYTQVLEQIKQKHQERMQNVKENLEQRREELKNRNVIPTIETKTEIMRNDEDGVKLELQQRRVEDRQEERQQRQENRQEIRNERQENRDVRGASTSLGFWGRIKARLGL